MIELLGAGEMSKNDHSGRKTYFTATMSNEHGFGLERVHCPPEGVKGVRFSIS